MENEIIPVKQRRRALALAGTVIAICFSVYGLILCLKITGETLGLIGFTVGIFLAPATFLIVPLYGVIVLGDWQPLLFSWGGILLVAASFWIEGLSIVEAVQKWRGR